MAAFVESRSSSRNSPRGLTYAATAHLVSRVPPTVVLQGIVRNEGPGSFTLHTGACPLGYRIYSSPTRSPKTLAYEFDPRDHPCLAIAIMKTLGANEEYVMSSDLIPLSGKVPPGHYDLSVMVHHDAVVREVRAGSIDIG